MESELGYQENPKDDNGIIRSSVTGGQIHSWEIPRSLKVLEILNSEFGRADFPGIYLLFDDGNSFVYVGQAKSLYERLKTHTNKPEDKCSKWSHGMVINDGRTSSLSDFNEGVRKAIEIYLINLFRANKYKVIAQGEEQEHNPTERSITESLIRELNFLLKRKGLITKLVEKPLEREILNDELHKALEKNGYRIDEWGVKDAIIDGVRTFIRPGSPKPQGWQITIRGKKADSFIDSLQKGNGFLLVPRDGILMIPLSVVKSIIDEDAFTQDTVDVWINFKEDSIVMNYKNNSIDLKEFRVLR